MSEWVSDWLVVFFTFYLSPGGVFRESLRAWFNGAAVLPDFCLVEAAAALSVTNSHRRRRSSHLEAERTFERLQQADVDHWRIRVVVVMVTGVRCRGTEHLQQLQPWQQATSHPVHLYFSGGKIAVGEWTTVTDPEVARFYKRRRVHTRGRSWRTSWSVVSRRKMSPLVGTGGADTSSAHFYSPDTLHLLTSTVRR